MSVPPKKTIFVEPTALYFPPPLTRHISNTVTVINSTDQPCVFKVHSFEPELYTVKPSAAVLAANSACRVLISLRKMKSEPDAARLAELNHKQKFKVRAKNVDAATYAKVSSGPTVLSGGDVWRLCEQVPYCMDVTLTCNFKGEIGAGANVTFETTGDMQSPPPTARSSTANNMRSPTPPPANNNGTNAGGGGGRAVSFVPSSAGNAAGAPQQAPAVKSSLKSSSADGSAAVAPSAAGVVAASSANIRANTNTKSAISNSIADHELRKAQLEQEIREKQALLASLAAAEADAAKKGGSHSHSHQKTKKKRGGLLMKKVSISVVLILVIVFYVMGSVVRAKIGGEHVTRYVESIVPAEVRSAVVNSKAALDGAVANSLSSFSATGIDSTEHNNEKDKDSSSSSQPVEASSVKVGGAEPEAAANVASAAGGSETQKPSSSPQSGGGKKKRVKRKKKDAVKTELDPSLA